MGCKWEKNQSMNDWPLASQEAMFESKTLLSNRIIEANGGLIPDWESWSLSKGKARDIVNIMSRDFSPSQRESLEFANLIPAGMTYFGQMLTHEIVPNSEKRKKRFTQTPGLNLESIYFGNRDNRKQRAMNGPKFIIKNTEENDRMGFDLTRDNNGVALIPEPRNDENIIIAQLHGLWLKLHNDAVTYLFRMAELNNTRISDNDAYCKAKTFVTLLFQKVVVQEFLRYILHPRVYRLYFIEKNEFIYSHSEANNFELPLEFSHAVFRFGHSMVRQIYRLNDQKKGVLVGELFNRKGKIDESLFIEWDRFFYFPDVIFSPQKASLTNLIVARGLTEIIEQVVSTNASGADFDLLKHKLFESGLVKLNGQYIANLVPNDIKAFYAMKAEDKKAGQKNFMGQAAVAVKNIIISDLKASTDVPTAGDFIKLLGEHGLYKLLRIPSPDRLIPEIDFSRASAGGIEAGLRGALNPDSGPLGSRSTSVPLWLFSMHEATKFPVTDEILTNEPNSPYVDKDCMGAISSVVIAETISMSIRQSETNIYQKWDSGPSNLKVKLGELSRVYSRINHEFESLTLSDVIDKKFFQNH